MDRQGASSAIPYRQLGRRLKDLRDRVGESLAEASGAVEIDVKQLAHFELGRTRPTEDVLLLLISHFGARDDEAVSLWELAGYDMGKIPATHGTNNDTSMFDSSQKVLFTDVVDVLVNNHGVVMNFMQSTGTGKDPQTIARIGMSREHAKSVLKVLQLTLNQTEQGSNRTTRLSTPDQDSTL